MISNSEDSSPQSTPDSRKKTIRWDEETIREQDKERGTRTKIAEVSTPFCYASDVDSQDESSSYYRTLENNELTKEVINRLCAIKETYDKKRQFAEHRKNHYSHEFDRNKINMSPDDNIDDDDDDDDNTEVINGNTCSGTSVAAP